MHVYTLNVASIISLHRVKQKVSATKPVEKSIESPGVKKKVELGSLRRLAVVDVVLQMLTCITVRKKARTFALMCRREYLKVMGWTIWHVAMPKEALGLFKMDKEIVVSVDGGL